MERAHELQVGAEKQAAYFLRRALTAEAAAAGWKKQFLDLCTTLLETETFDETQREIVRRMAAVAGAR